MWRTIMERTTVIGKIQTTIDAIKITDFSRKKICLFAKQNSFKNHFHIFVSHLLMVFEAIHLKVIYGKR